jgi:hypothetical protein
MSSIVTKLQSLDDTMSELDGVQKILRVMPPRYAQMACSIETLLDLKQLPIEELSGHLAASEGRGEPELEMGGKLYLTKEEWLARTANRQPGSGGSGQEADLHTSPSTTLARLQGTRRTTLAKVNAERATAGTVGRPVTGPRSAKRQSEIASSSKPTWHKLQRKKRRR